MNSSTLADLADAEVTPPPDHDAVPFVAATTAVVLWGIGPLFVHATSVSGVTVSFYRMWLAVPVMSGLMWLAGGRYTWGGMRTSALGGVLFSVCIVFGFTSNQTTSIADSTLIPALLPLLVFVVAGKWFGETVTPRDIAVGLCGLLGVAAVVAGGRGAGTAHLSGDLAAVANLFAWTLYFLEVKRCRRAGIPAMTYLAGVFVVGAVVLTPFALLVSPDLGAMRGIDYVLVLAVVLLPGAAGHGLMTWAQRSVNVTVSSVLTLVSPVVSAAGAWWLIGQPLTPVQIAGGAAVLAAMGFLSLVHRADPVEAAR